MNKEKLITIIFPSRGRYDLVKRLLLSIEEKTYNKDWIEVISICDHDDKETLDLFHELSSQITYDFKFVSRKQKEELDLPNDYYDLGLKLASDSYFTWILGNDCEILTENWDAYINNQFAEDEFGLDNYYYISISDNTHLTKNGPISWHPCCCFPLLSRNYIDDFKEFYPKELPTWGGDVVLWNIAKYIPKFKMIDLTNKIEIEHYTAHTKKYKKDENFKRMEKNASIQNQDINLISLQIVADRLNIYNQKFIN